MTLDEYRAVLLERLWDCQDTAAARTLLAEANLMLSNGQISRVIQDRFWETLEEDLEAVGKDVMALKDPKAALGVEAVVTAARARIARYRKGSDDT